MKRTTIYDIAKEAGVSIATIHRAFKPDGKISDIKRELILNIAKKRGYSSNKLAVGLSRKNIKIGVIIIGLIPDFYNHLINGIKKSHENLFDFKVDCDIKLILPINSSDEEYIKILDNYQNESYDGIILSAIFYSDKIVDKVNELVDKGIVIATLMEDTPPCKRLFTTLNNRNAAGKMAAELLSMNIQQNNKVIIFSGHLISNIHKDILSGFKQEANDRGLKILDIYDTKDSPEQASILAQKALLAHEDVNGIYISSANSIPICKKVVEMGLNKKVKIIASDVFPELCEYIRSDVVNATIFQNPFLQAKTTFENLYYHIAEKHNIKEYTMITPEIVIKSNLHLYEEEPN